MVVLREGICPGLNQDVIQALRNVDIRTGRLCHCSVGLGLRAWKSTLFQFIAKCMYLQHIPFSGGAGLSQP